MSNLAVVVLMHNQAGNLPALLPAYEAQAQPGLFVFVLDRCTDNTDTRLKEFAATSSARVELVSVSSSSVFQAGANRDAGLRAAETVMPGCNVLFLDGDCVPSVHLFANTSAVLNLNASLPIAACGRRINTTESGSSVEDNRIRNFLFAEKVFTAGVNRVVVSRDAALSRMVTWSCCLGLNRAAIKALRSVNNRIDHVDRVFNPAFDGRWGGEDDFIGVSLAHLGGALVTMDPVDNFVTHIWHPTRANKVYEITSRRKTSHVRNLASRTDAPGVARITTCGDDEITQAVSCAHIYEPQILACLADKFGLRGFERVAIMSAASVHKVVLKTATKIDPSQDQRNSWSGLRGKLTEFTNTAWDANTILPDVKYYFDLPSEGPCTVCGSSRGFNGNGQCRSCCAMPWHRLADRELKARDAGVKKLVINAELRGEREMTSGWSRTSFSGLHGDTKADVCNLPFQTGEFDTIYSAHTLEHVHDEKAAFDELARVLSDDGSLFLCVPVKPGKTDENLTDTLTKEERTRRFYWHDHWRVYGLADAATRFSQYGFKTEVVTAGPGLPGVTSDETMFVLTKSKVRLAPPSHLHLDVSTSCNYKCAHCWIHKQHDTGGIDKEFYKSVIREFKKIGGTTLGFCYGESMLNRPLVIELAGEARDAGLDVDIVSNGTGFQSDIETLARLFTRVTFSLDSHVSDKHDKIRGVPGAFARVIKAVAELRKFDARPLIYASCVVHHNNVADFRAYEEEMLRLGFDGAGFTVIEPTFGLTMLMRDEFYEKNRMLPEDADILAGQLSSATSTWNIEAVLDTIRGIRKPVCGSSTRNMIINRDGSVKLCYTKQPVTKITSATELFTAWSGVRSAVRRAADSTCDLACGASNCHRKRP